MKNLEGRTSLTLSICFNILFYFLSVTLFLYLFTRTVEANSTFKSPGLLSSKDAVVDTKNIKEYVDANDEAIENSLGDLTFGLNEDGKAGYTKDGAFSPFFSVNSGQNGGAYPYPSSPTASISLPKTRYSGTYLVYNGRYYAPQ